MKELPVPDIGGKVVSTSTMQYAEPNYVVTIEFTDGTTLSFATEGVDVHLADGSYTRIHAYRAN